MKHILTTLLLLVTCSVMAQTEECKVPLSIVERNLTGRYAYEERKFEDPKNRNEREFMRFFDQNGFTTDIKYGRLSLCVDHVTVDNFYYHRLFRVVDMQENVILFSNRIDTVDYPGTNLRSGNWNDIKDYLPLYRSMADSLRTTVIDFYESITKDVIKSARQYASKGDHKAALYVLAQYPECCRSYPQIRDCTVAMFRNYMKKNHKELFKIAKHVWDNRSSEIDARFVVALLNSETFSAKEQKTANKMLEKVAKEYPNLDIKAQEDYAFVAELKAAVLKQVRDIAIEYSYSDDLIEHQEFVPKDFI